MNLFVSRREFLKQSAGTAALPVLGVQAEGWNSQAPKTPATAINAALGNEDELSSIDPAEVKIGGEIGRRIAVTVKYNVLRLNVDGDFLASFEKKDDMHVPFTGTGMLIDAVSKLAYYTRDENLISLKEHLTGQVIKWQTTDGYIGNLGPEGRMVRSWDICEVGYIIYGLITDYKLFGDQRSLAAARKAADYLLNNWSKLPPDWDKQTKLATFVNVTGLDRTMLTLYAVTGDQRYLDFELKQMNLPNWNPGIVIGRRTGLEGHVYAYMAASLAQLELFRLHPEKKLLDPTMEGIHFITDHDGMAITGGVGVTEIWTADQDGGRDRAETCAAAYQIRVYDSLLKLQGDARYGDLMERTIFNTLFGAQVPEGRRIRYFTPLEGDRVETTDIRCCANNYRRIISDLPSLVYYRAGKGLAINLYSASQVKMVRNDGSSLTVQQETNYPSAGHVLIRLDPSVPASFPVRLRIPSWCPSAAIAVNGESWEGTCTPGTFAVVERVWKAGDQIVMDMPMEWRLVQGRQREAGRAAVMRGPMVFCLDPSQFESMPELDADDLGRIVIDLASIEPTPVPSNAVRPDGIACRVKASTNKWALGDEGDSTMTLTEFPDPGGKVTYFRVPDLSKTTADELIGLWETNKGKPSSLLEPHTPA